MKLLKINIKEAEIIIESLEDLILTNDAFCELLADKSLKNRLEKSDVEWTSKWPQRKKVLFKAISRLARNIGHDN